MALLYFIWLSACFTASKTRKIWIATEGEAFVAECPEADLDEAVTWRFAERDITTDKGERIYSSGIELWFLPTALQDSGNYTCTKHKYASNETETVSVTIHPYKEGNCYYEDALYREVTGSPGSGKISCPSFDNYENAFDVKWYKDCQYLQGSRYRIEEGRLYISRANEADNGKYTCRFTYSSGGKKFNVSATRSFRIGALSLPKPIQVLYPKDNEVIDAEIGFLKNLSCKAWLGAGEQRLAKSFWYYNHEKEPNRFVECNNSYMEPDKGHFTEAILTIKEVRKEDFNVTFSCFLMNDRGFKKVNVTLRHKAPGHSNVSLVIGFIILFTAITIMVWLYNFFRIDIVLFCRRIFNCTKSNNDGKIYDAYVICPSNHENGTCENNFMSSFVYQILPEVLENQCGYKLCIYGRDVLPGEDAIVAVETRIKASRRLIILITQSLVWSRYFTYEHQVAFYNALIQDNVKVILLEMERMGDSAQLQDSLRHIMNRQGTIKWNEKYMPCPSSTHSAFWKHVKYQMPVRRKHPPT